MWKNRGIIEEGAYTFEAGAYIDIPVTIGGELTISISAIAPDKKWRMGWNDEHIELLASNIEDAKKEAISLVLKDLKMAVSILEEY